MERGLGFFEEIEKKRGLYLKYGTTTPEQDYEDVYDYLSDSSETIPIKELVDAIDYRIKEITARNRIGIHAIANRLQAIKSLIKVKVRAR